MRLYHYTSVSFADRILISDLSRGHMLTPEDKIISPVIWLTTDSNYEGHGLTDGKSKLSDRDLEHCERTQGTRPKNRFTTDKTKVRLTFDVPDDKLYTLIKFTEFCESTFKPYGRLFSKLTGLSCYKEVTEVSKDKLKILVKTFPTKEDTWWISLTSLSSKYISAIDLLGTDRKYYSYDFDGLARKPFEDLGLFVPNAQSLKDLQKLLKSAHPLQQVKAIVVCVDPKASPLVAIWSNADMVYSIRDSLPTCDSPATNQLVSDWVTANRQELLNLYEKATESYFKFYSPT